MHLVNSFVIGSLALVASAQSAFQNSTAASYAAQIPECARACDEAAIVQVGCDLTDYACHCFLGDQLASLIPPCLQGNSTCTTDDLRTFATLPAKICDSLNATTSSNSTTNTTISSTTISLSATRSPTPTPTFGSGASATPTNAAGINGVATALFAVAGAGILGIVV